VLAQCWQCWQSASVPVQITIRDVPEQVRDELAMRAARDGKSMQEYLRGELMRMAQRPSVQTWLEQVRKRKEAEKRRVPSKDILRHREADRR
jgi:plasmid stability protein